MIIFDLSQIAISNVMKSPNIASGTVDTMLIKHMILNSIKMYKNKFGEEFGPEIVIACDSNKEYWRKTIFPHYKASRKDGRESSSINWKEVFDAVSIMKDDLRQNFPYKVIEVDHCEADDIIAVIGERTQEPCLIISGDKDMVQLQKNPYVKQYAPIQKKFVECDNPADQLFELIVCGDKGDGIPNIKSDSDVFVTEKRQLPISKKNLAIWNKTKNPHHFCETKRMLENFQRNKDLIDFSCIPDTYRVKILEEYKKEPVGKQGMIYNYLVKNRMKLLLKYVGDF